MPLLDEYCDRYAESFAAAGLGSSRLRPIVAQTTWSHTREYECSDMGREYFVDEPISIPTTISISLTHLFRGVPNGPKIYSNRFNGLRRACRAQRARVGVCMKRVPIPSGLSLVHTAKAVC